MMPDPPRPEEIVHPDPSAWRDMERQNPEYFASEIRTIPGLDPIDVAFPLRRGAMGPVANETSHYSAWRYLLQHTREPGIRLVHGRHDAGAGTDSTPTAQAWVELGDDLVFDGLTRRFYAADAFRATTHAERDRSYTSAEAARLMLKTGHAGPWNEAERHEAGVE